MKINKYAKNENNALQVYPSLTCTTYINSGPASAPLAPLSSPPWPGGRPSLTTATGDLPEHSKLCLVGAEES